MIRLSFVLAVNVFAEQVACRYFLPAAIRCNPRNKLCVDQELAILPD
jgi:hypothetical protein